MNPDFVVWLHVAAVQPMTFGHPLHASKPEWAGIPSIDLDNFSDPALLHQTTTAVQQSERPALILLGEPDASIGPIMGLLEAFVSHPQAQGTVHGVLSPAILRLLHQMPSLTHA